jgi:hypothetical protein
MLLLATIAACVGAQGGILARVSLSVQTLSAEFTMLPSDHDNTLLRGAHVLPTRAILVAHPLSRAQSFKISIGAEESGSSETLKHVKSFQGLVVATRNP